MTSAPAELQGFFTPFSFPHDPNLVAFAGEVSRQDGVLRIERALEAHATALTSHGEGVAALLAAWCEDPEARFWHPALGTVRAACPTTGAGAPLPLVDLGIAATLAGRPEPWSFSLASAESLLVHDQVLHQVIRGEVWVRTHTANFRFVRSDGREQLVVLQRDPEGLDWSVIEAPSDAGPTCLAWEDHAAPRLVPGSLWGGLATWRGTKFVEPGDLDQASRCLADGHAVLQAHAPRFVPWVQDVVPFLAPSLTRGVQESCSDRRLPGFLTISVSSRPIITAEMLVHEASHQWCFLLERLGPIDDGTDERCYHSHLAKRARPVSRVLLAFHALGNMILMYRQCLEAGFVDEGHVERRLPEMEAGLQEMHTSLSSSPALTDVGRALWLPLAEAAGLPLLESSKAAR